jgi:radical SAM superfamily enzyme YgiQ (UPF0313 family)
MTNNSKDNRTDVLLLLPPQWTPLSPYYALPILAGEFKNAGYSCLLRDLNVEFFHRILSPEYLTWCRLGVENRLENLREDFINSIADLGPEAFSSGNNIYSEIQGKLEQSELYWDIVINNIDQAKHILKTEELFYDPQKLQWAFHVICQGLEIAGLPYYPSKIMLRDFRNRNHKLTIESVTEATENKAENPFLDFYDLVLPTIIDMNPHMIGISINAFSQVVGGLTLAKLLKASMPDTHINIGGNFFTRVIDTLAQKPEFFESFCHSLIYEEGEIPSVKLIETIKSDKDLSKVPNLLYKDGKEVKITPKCEPKKLDDIAIPDLSGLDLSAYISPEIVLPMQASRGCYWKKCTFCDHDYGVKYNLKSPKKLVEEMRSLKENFGIKNFEFIDEAISPAYLRRMCQAIIDDGLEVQWFMYGRTEKGFEKELLELAYKAGCRMIMWGVESGSKRIMELINKGIDIDNRFAPLKNANAAGIWNFCFIFFGFPTETPEEAMLTIDMIMDNKDVINSYGQSIFTLGKHTQIRETPDKYGIVDIKEDEEDLSTKLNYRIIKGMTQEQVDKACELCTAISDRIYFAPLWFSIGFREFLHLYLDKYGLDYVKQYSYIDDTRAEQYKKT